MASNGKGKAKGGDGKERMSVGEHTTPVHAPLIHISGYTSLSLSTSRHLVSNFHMKQDWNGLVFIHWKGDDYVV